ncbi:MAG TPA: YegS/Rv2252/BmrU family lipid kinase [Chitinophagaceae bacterium]|nr:YegS/Rv2252/BmrU family lipid kinase [Chitinophagaceae bacterium]
MTQQQPLKLLFIINPGSGNKSIDWSAEIDQFFEQLPHSSHKYVLTKACTIDTIKGKIDHYKPDRVIAVGGDGTVKLVAECLLHTPLVLGILPAGSANGLAKELGVPADTKGALQHLLKEETKRIHLVKVNDELCIHLSDIGFNATVIKLFESEKKRGMFGYVKAAWKVLLRHSLMQATIKYDDGQIRRDAAMIVIANATRYGSGAVINPLGELTDKLFEIVIVKKLSFTEIFKMMVTHAKYDSSKTELLQAQMLDIVSKKKVHFQVDGEYLGKVNKIHAEIIPDALSVVL